jgi:hypothetical protein
MSLPQFSAQDSLFGVGSLAKDLFTPDNFYQLFSRKIYPLLAKARVQLEAAGYSPTQGRPANEPVIMLGLCVLQFLERMPDRQAMEHLKYHLGWKLALNVELQQDCFHPTSLCYFRQRLLDHDLSHLAFQSILDGLQEAALVRKRSPQRLDSTHVLGLVAHMSVLERVRQTLRLALEDLESTLEQSALPSFWVTIWERYVESQPDFRAKVEVLKAKLAQCGQDIAMVLAWIKTLPQDLAQLPKLKLLEQVFAENFELTQEEVKPLKKHGARVVRNPHDPEAQWCTKSSGDAKKEWVGYKVQVAETVAEEGVICQKGEPTAQFLSSMYTQNATSSDEAGMGAVLENQRKSGLDTPKELYTDGAYISGRQIALAQQEGRELLGPAQASPAKNKAYGSEAFTVDIQKRSALCPAGKTSTQFSRLEEQSSGKVNFRIEFGRQCHDCPMRKDCISPGQKHRTLVVGEYHEALQARRLEQQTEAFKERVKRRNAIEGSHSELVRAHGLRKARYRGLAKVSLQNQLIGAACNAKRWLRRLAWEMACKALHK